MFPTASDRFDELMSQTESELALDEAMLTIGAHANPHADIEAGLRTLDDLAERCPAPTLDGVARQLFQYEGFAGNRDDYYDPRNSLLDRVLERKVGIPITLSVLAIEVGRRVGAPMAPVGMPGHFLVRDRVLDDVFVDGFHGGAILDGAKCQRLFRSLHGPNAQWNPNFLDPIGKHAVVLRTLNNLRAIAERASDRTSLRWILRLQRQVPGGGIEPSTRLAGLLAEIGQYGLAADEYDLLAARVPESSDELAAQAAQLRARLN